MKTPRQFAVLIGIDRYPLLADRLQLDGCVNDVRLLARLLCDERGFPAEAITTLENEQATHDGIWAAWRGLLGRVGHGDTVVIGYSGHGSRVRDPDGDEPDGWDEAIVPHDSGRAPHPNRDIRDDEIHEWLLDLSEITPNITLIFDSCFSGGITRDPFAAKTRWVPEDDRVPGERGLLPTRRFNKRSFRRGPSGWLPLSDRYVLIAGCRHGEYSNEIRLGDRGEPAHGALTHFLCRAIRNGAPGATHLDVYERASAEVTARFPSQHPQLEGAFHRTFCGMGTFQPMRFLPVRERLADGVALAGGAAHGLTKGSEWAVYPQGTKRIDPEVPRLGRLRIRQVEAVRSEAEILEEAGMEKIQPGDRAVEEVHCFGDVRLAVAARGHHPAGAGLADLVHAIGQSVLLRIVDGDVWGVKVCRIAPRAAAGADDPVPQLGPLTEEVWAAVGLDGRLVAPALPVNDDGSISRLVKILEHRARYQLAFQLDNHASESTLRGKITLELLRHQSGAWEVAQPEKESGEILFVEKDRLALQITNASDDPVHIAVLDFGLTARVSQIWPVPGSYKALDPGRRQDIGIRRAEELELALPEGFPFEPPAAGAPVGRTEHVKVFATTEPADFTILCQEGYQFAQRATRLVGAGPAWELLQSGKRPGAMRDLCLIHRAVGDWATVKRSFFLRRR